MLSRHIIVKFPCLDRYGQIHEESFFARIIHATKNGFFVVKENGVLTYVSKQTYKQYWRLSTQVLSIINEAAILKHRRNLTGYFIKLSPGERLAYIHANWSETLKALAD